MGTWVLEETNLFYSKLLVIKICKGLICTSVNIFRKILSWTRLDMNGQNFVVCDRNMNHMYINLFCETKCSATNGKWVFASSFYLSLSVSDNPVTLFLRGVDRGLLCR